MTKTPAAVVLPLVIVGFCCTATADEDCVDAKPVSCQFMANLCVDKFCPATTAWQFKMMYLDKVVLSPTFSYSCPDNTQEEFRDPNAPVNPTSCEQPGTQRILAQKLRQFQCSRFRFWQQANCTITTEVDEVVQWVFENGQGEPGQPCSCGQTTKYKAHCNPSGQSGTVGETLDTIDCSQLAPCPPGGGVILP